MTTSAQAHLKMTLDLPTRPPAECKVLVVDDESEIVKMFSAYLAKDGYQILEAYSGLGALEVVRAERPDVIVLDVMLPDVDGIEVCRRIKQAEETRLTPVILVTGWGERDRRLGGLMAGADDFLGKPLDPFELVVRVRSLLRTKQLYDEVEEQHRELERRVEQRTRELLAANERLAELGQVKSRVLAIVSHELRTPLHQATLALGLIRQEGISPYQREDSFRELEEALGVLAYRLDDVEALSDPGDLKLAPASVTTLLVSAIEQVRRLRRKERDVFVTDIPADLPPVMVDARLMARAIAHVIHNAAKFGNGKPVYIRAEAHRASVVITVRDEGDGIPAGVRERLFEPLQAGDDRTTRRYPGMGIGLALAKAVMDAHGVGLEIESTPGVGTAVSLTLPLIAG